MIGYMLQYWVQDLCLSFARYPGDYDELVEEQDGGVTDAWLGAIAQGGKGRDHIGGPFLANSLLATLVNGVTGELDDDLQRRGDA